MSELENFNSKSEEHQNSAEDVIQSLFNKLCIEEIEDSEWLTVDKKSFTPNGRNVIIERAWDIYPALLPHAGDEGVADLVFDLISTELPARELNLLASESIAACHGRDLLFGQEGMSSSHEEEGLGMNGPFGASATWSRGMLLVSILRTAPTKRAKFIQSSLPEVSRLLLGHDEEDGDGISKVLALIIFLRALCSSDNDNESNAALILHTLDSAAACGVVPAGPCNVEASSLMTPDIHALWCGLACLAFGDPYDKPFDWPECISFLPPFVPCLNQKTMQMVDTISLLQHPWRYAYRLWEKARMGERLGSSNGSIVEFGLGQNEQRPWSSLGLSRLVYWLLSNDIAPRAHGEEFMTVKSPSMIGLWVFSPAFLFNLIAPHALTLMLHSYGEGGGQDEEEGVAYGDAAAGEAMLSFVCHRLKPNTLKHQLYIEPMSEDPEESSQPKHPVVSDPEQPWKGSVNIRVMLQMVIDKMVSCPNATRRSTLRLVLEKVISALDATSAHELLSYIIPICPHQQAKAWLLDTARRCILQDLDTLLKSVSAASSSSDSQRGNNDSEFKFLGDDNLEPYLLGPLSVCAADTKPATLSDSLDTHLAALATCRILLLRRKAIPEEEVRARVCSEQAVELIARSVKKIQKTLASFSSSTSSLKDPKEEMGVVPEAVVNITSVQGEPIALAPTPSMSSFHLELLSEATTYIIEILDN